MTGPALRAKANPVRASTMRRLRPWVQTLAFIFFVVLLVLAGRVSFLPADLFFRLDPLAGLAGMLAARRVVPALLVGGLITLALTVFAGRAWCGWLCPLGTVLDWTPSRKPAPKETDLRPRWRQVKYFLLALIARRGAAGQPQPDIPGPHYADLPHFRHRRLARAGGHHLGGRTGPG